MALPRNNRIKRKKDFELVFKKGRAISGHFLFAKFRPSDSGMPRFGFVISSRTAKKAVDRNRLRRVLSAAVRPNLSGLAAYDTVIVVTKKADSKEIINDLQSVLKKAKI